MARCAGLTDKSLLMRSLASLDTVEKYSAGKEKSHRRMLLVVSSSESSKKGERPLEKYKKTEISQF